MARHGVTESCFDQHVAAYEHMHHSLHCLAHTLTPSMALPAGSCPGHRAVAGGASPHRSSTGSFSSQPGPGSVRWRYPPRHGQSLPGMAGSVHLLHKHSEHLAVDKLGQAVYTLHMLRTARSHTQHLGQALCCLGQQVEL